MSLRIRLAPKVTDISRKDSGTVIFDSIFMTALSALLGLRSMAGLRPTRWSTVMNQIQEKALDTLVLDSSFAEGGVLKLPIPQTVGQFLAVTLALPQDKLLVVLDVPPIRAAVVTSVRLTASGTVDKSFGDEGVVEVSFDDFESNLIAIVTGITPWGEGWLTQFNFEYGSAFGVGVIRQYSDGKLDTSFGEGGKSFINIARFGIPGAAPANEVFDQRGRRSALENTSVANGRAGASAVELADGKIILKANIAVGNGSTGVVLRLDKNGLLDTTFNNEGFVLVKPLGIDHESSTAISVAAQLDGKVLVCGSLKRRGFDLYDAYVARFDAVGEVDPHFGSNGVVVVSEPSFPFWDFRDVAVRESNNTIVLVGAAEDGTDASGLIVVLNASGTFNLIFNQGKPLLSNFQNRSLVWTHCSLALSQGLIIVSGDFGLWGAGEHPVDIARYTWNGALDSWGSYGESNLNEASLGVTSAESNKVVVWGSPRVAGSFDSGWLLRYLA